VGGSNEKRPKIVKKRPKNSKKKSKITLLCLFQGGGGATEKKTEK